MMLVQGTLDPAAQDIITRALEEDLSQGDITTDNLPGLSEIQQTAQIRVRQACVISGLQVAAGVFHAVDPTLIFEPRVEDGANVPAGSILASVSGTMASILKAERTALNLLQHLCGIATETHRYVEAVSGTHAKVTHTRKTTPGLRILEQQAVLHGGGMPHRLNLGACVMLKDNHLQALATKSAHPIADAIGQLRQRLSHTVKIEVEADRLEQVREAVEAGADIILLDNMTPEQIRETLTIIDKRAISEASGGINLQNIRAYAETGVDYISTSRITLGVPAIDIGLDLE